MMDEYVTEFYWKSANNPNWVTEMGVQNFFSRTGAAVRVGFLVPFCLVAFVILNLCFFFFFFAFYFFFFLLVLKLMWMCRETKALIFRILQFFEITLIEPMSHASLLLMPTKEKMLSAFSGEKKGNSGNAQNPSEPSKLLLWFSSVV